MNSRRDEGSAEFHSVADGGGDARGYGLGLGVVRDIDHEEAGELFFRLAERAVGDDLGAVADLHDPAVFRRSETL